MSAERVGGRRAPDGRRRRLLGVPPGAGNDGAAAVAVYAINLDRRPDRLEVLMRRASLAGLDIERVSGVDGRTLAPEDPRAALFDRTKLTATEIAIAITHIQIWEEVASSATETGALILEDDVRFMPGFVRNARRALALAHQSPSFYSHAKPQDGKNAASSSVAFSVAKPEDGKNAGKPGDGTIAAGDGDDWPLIWLSAINRGYNSVNDGRTPSAVSMAGEAPNVAPTGWDYFGGMWCYLLSRGAAKRLVTLAHATRALNGPGIGRAIDAWIAHLGPAAFPTLTATPMIAWAPVARHGADSDIQTARAFLPPSTSPPSAHPIAPPTIAQPALLAPAHMSVANPFTVARPSPSADTNIESPPSVGIPPLNSPAHPADTPGHPGQSPDTRGQSADAILDGGPTVGIMPLNSTVGGSKPSRAAESGQVVAAVDGSGQVVTAVDGSGQVVAAVDGSQVGRLGFRGLGRLGRLGNQLFQIAAALVLSGRLGLAPPVFSDERTGHKWSHVASFAAPSTFWSPLAPLASSSSAGGGGVVDLVKPAAIVKESGDFCELDVVSVMESVRLAGNGKVAEMEGYFQNARYFDGDAERTMLRAVFQPSEAVLMSARTRMEQLLGKGVDWQKCCAVHVRRGDYMEQNISLPLAYYIRAIAIVRARLPEATFVVLTDDVSYVQQSVLGDWCAVLAERPTCGDYEDIALMSLCGAHIVANSSFSWWGAYLSPSSLIVVAPRTWFAHMPASQNLVCRSWVALDYARPMQGWELESTTHRPWTLATAEGGHFFAPFVRALDPRTTFVQQEEKADALILSVFGNRHRQQQRHNHHHGQTETPRPCIFVCGEPRTPAEVEAVTASLKLHCGKAKGAVSLPFWIPSFFERTRHRLEDFRKKATHGCPPLKAPKVKWCAFMYGNEVAERNAFFDLLHARKRVDALGRCRRNTESPVDRAADGRDGRESFYDLAVKRYEPYKFVIAYESRQIDDYITEKLVNPMLCDEPPVIIYCGAPNLAEHFNPRALINIADYTSPGAAIDHILAVDASDAAYEAIRAQPFLLPHHRHKSHLARYAAIVNAAIRNPGTSASGNATKPPAAVTPPSVSMSSSISKDQKGRIEPTKDQATTGTETRNEQGESVPVMLPSIFKDQKGVDATTDKATGTETRNGQEQAMESVPVVASIAPKIKEGTVMNAGGEKWQPNQHVVGARPSMAGLAPRPILCAPHPAHHVSHQVRAAPAAAAAAAAAGAAAGGASEAGCEKNGDGDWTVVTGLFDIATDTGVGSGSTNRPIDFYLRYRFVLELDRPLIMFCDPATYPKAWAVRRQAGLLHKTCFVSMKMRDFPFWRYHDVIKENRRKPPVYDAGHRNTPAYFILTVGKFHMLKRAVSMNPFGTRHIAWLDFGLQHIGDGSQCTKALVDAAFALNRRKPRFCYIAYVPPAVSNDAFRMYHQGDGRCTIASSFFTGANEEMVALCDEVEKEFERIVGLGRGHAEEQILCTVHGRNPSAFELYYGDYECQLHNYVSISRNAHAVLEFFTAPAVADHNWSWAAQACLALADAAFSRRTISLPQNQAARLLELAAAALPKTTLVSPPQDIATLISTIRHSHPSLTIPEPLFTSAAKTTTPMLFAAAGIHPPVPVAGHGPALAGSSQTAPANKNGGRDGGGDGKDEPLVVGDEEVGGSRLGGPRHDYLELDEGEWIGEEEAERLAAAAFVWVDAVVYINLERRKDRRAEIELEMARVKVPKAKIHRFPAIEHVSPMVGCNMSHLAVLKMAQERGWRNVAVFEDDFDWVRNRGLVWKHMARFAVLHGPARYDVAMLTSGGIQFALPCDDIVTYANRAPNAAGYIVAAHYYATLIACWEDATEKLKRTGRVDLYISDQAWQQLQQNTNGWLAFTPMLGYQRPSISDLNDGGRQDHHGVTPFLPKPPPKTTT
jgi:GR25 family glycosyltransferase involved in LPS biosynthesis